METLVLIYLTTNPRAHFTIYTVYTAHRPQTVGQEMTVVTPNTFGDTTYVMYSSLVSAYVSIGRKCVLNKMCA